jgi:hypothetical protein
MALLDLQGMAPEYGQGHGHGGGSYYSVLLCNSNASVLLCV